MNASTKTLFTALIAVAGAAALGLGLVTSVPAPSTQIVKLDRVVVYGKRAPAAVQTAQGIEQLPRVVVQGRRASAPVQLATAESCGARTSC